MVTINIVIHLGMQNTGPHTIKIPVLPSRNNLSEFPNIIRMCNTLHQAPEKVSNSSYKRVDYKVKCNSKTNVVERTR